MFAVISVALPSLSRPDHRWPGYALFLACLLPWSLWLVRIVLRRGGAEPISLLVQAGVVLAFTYPMEIIATYGRDWDYFQDRDVLLGARLGGVPLEEYLFYPLFLNLALLIYLLACERIRAARLADLAVSRLLLRRLLLGSAVALAMLAAWVWSLPVSGAVLPATRSWDAFGVPHYAEGARDFSWTLTCLVALACNLAALYAAERFTPMQLRAVIPATFVFATMGLLFDLLGVSRGWWVYNVQHVSGVWLGPIPVENLAMYACAVPETVAVFEASRRLFGERGTA